MSNEELAIWAIVTIASILVAIMIVRGERAPRVELERDNQQQD